MPAGVEGELVYNATYKVAQFCNGTHWISMAGQTIDPRIGDLTANKFCGVSGDGSTIDCSLDAPAAPTTLALLTDVNTSGAGNGKVLTYNGTSNKWEAVTPAGTLSGGNSGYIGIWSGASTMGFSGTSVGQQLVWDGINHRLGIGTAGPAYALDVKGTVRATTYLYPSDARLKADIETIDGVTIVSRLRGVSFRWKDSGKPATGVIAQEVEAVLPTAVSTDATGQKSIDYVQLIGPLIEAVKDLKADNDNLRSDVDELKRSLIGTK
jgi:hypothetical protein